MKAYLTPQRLPVHTLLDDSFQCCQVDIQLLFGQLREGAFTFFPGHYLEWENDHHINFLEPVSSSRENTGLPQRLLKCTWQTCSGWPWLLQLCCLCAVLRSPSTTAYKLLSSYGANFHPAVWALFSECAPRCDDSRRPLFWGHTVWPGLGHTICQLCNGVRAPSKPSALTCKSEQLATVYILL